MKWLRDLTILVWILFLGAPGSIFAQHLVDVNKADVETLKSLQGIGDIRAQAIIKYREQHGPFKSLDDLKSVSGIGDKIIDQNKSHITFAESKPDAKPHKAADSR